MKTKVVGAPVVEELYPGSFSIGSRSTFLVISYVLNVNGKCDNVVVMGTSEDGVKFITWTPWSRLGNDWIVCE